jgi:Fe-S cluster assembly protein SufB
MEWVDGNIGSMRNMKYPACILKGDGAKGSVISIAVGGKNQFQDNGARMIHIGKNTSSTIISKSICKNGGTANYRGTVRILSRGGKCPRPRRMRYLDSRRSSRGATRSEERDSQQLVYIEHEATVSKINEEQLFYLDVARPYRSAATQMIVMGFIEPFSKELPMEYAVELEPADQT